jgi:hypothetical protein
MILKESVIMVSVRFFRAGIIVALLLRTFVPVQETHAQGTANAMARTESNEFAFSSRRDTADAIHVVQKANGEEFVIPITKDVHHVEELTLAGPNRLLAQAAHNNFGRASTLLVLDLSGRAVLDQLIGSNFLLSPDKRYVAFVEWQPGHFDNGTSSLLYVYDLAAPPAENRIIRSSVGIPIYPANMLNSKVSADQQHTFGGQFTWLAGTDVLAFEDEFQGKLSLVTIDLRPGVRNHSTFVQPIDSSILGQSSCPPGYHITGIGPSAKGDGFVSVDLESGATRCGKFDVALPPSLRQ